MAMPRSLAKTPFHDHLYATYPVSRLSASGLDVGLPEGQMGNSEVGHLNLGAGRIVYQDLTRINKAVADGELAKNPVLAEAFRKAKGSRLHLLGLDLRWRRAFAPGSSRSPWSTPPTMPGSRTSSSTPSPMAATLRLPAARIIWPRSRNKRPAGP